jgi:hypothetical protein
MAKANKVSKTQAVKNLLKANPDATGKVISETLEKQGIDITPSYAGNIKSELSKQQRSKKPGTKSAAAPSKGGAAAKAGAQPVNKTHAVKEYLNAHHQAKPLEVVEALKKDGIEVTANYVATIKSKGKRRRKAVKQVVEKTGIGLPEIKAAISLLKLTNGAAGAREALAAAQEIMKIV